MNLKSGLAVLIAVLFLATSFGSIAVAGARTSDIKVNQAYEKYVEDTLTSLGTWNGYGFRVAGSPAEIAAAKFVASEMKKIGLSNVRLEPVPVDAWDFKGASLTVNGPDGSSTFVAASMGGVPGTPPGGVSGEIVYVDQGLPENYPADGVQGKLLLVDWDADTSWVNLIANQATLDGAKGVIIGTMDYPSYYEWPSSLGSFDATYNDAWVPLITISRDDGFAIMDMLANGPVCGTMVSDVKMTLSEQGGTGYNVVGVLPGRDHSRQILILGHHDSWFTGASDDTSSQSAMLAWAKALKKSNFVPNHDIVFVSETAEEYGYTNAYYEWLVGMWYLITHSHPGWAKSMIAFLNLEGIGGRWFDGSTGPFDAETNFELAPLVEEVFSANPALLPSGWTIETTLNSWTDGWTLTAAGLAGVTFGATIPGYDAVYHTNMDNVALINYDDMAQQVMVMNKVLTAIDSARLLPYKFSERALDMSMSYDPDAYSAVGVDITALESAVEDFGALASNYDSISSNLAGKEKAANALLARTSRLINSQWTALSVWDDTIYPTQQVEWDAYSLVTAIDQLRHHDAASAEETLVNVGLTYNSMFDYPVFKYENDRHAPGALHLDWGGQGHLAPYLDIYWVYKSVQEKAEKGGHQDFRWEIKTLQHVLNSERMELQNRVLLELQQVTQVNSMLTDLIEMAG